MKKSAFLILFILLYSNSFSQAKPFQLLVGTYTKNCNSNGIYVYDFNSENGELKLKSSSEKIVNPSFLSISEDNKTVYAVSENGDKSKINAFAYDEKKGNLKFLNSKKAAGNDPCFVINDEKNVIIANYSGGNIAVFGKKVNGALTNLKQVVPHFGKSTNLNRQEKPHVHQVQFSPDKSLVFANDLGTDKIYIYKYNSKDKTKLLTLNDSIAVKNGSGPRHLTFSKNGQFVYLLQELDAMISVYRFENQTLQKIEEYIIYRDDFLGEISAADVHISPDGKFLYASNRGTVNEITCFEILKNGKLRFIDNTSTLGKTPRNFAIDPSGNFLLVSNQNSNNIVVFKRDKFTGKLTNTNQSINLCAPVCLIFKQ
jgi:6-phosphogluconolactonase